MVLSPTEAVRIAKIQYMAGRCDAGVSTLETKLIGSEAPLMKLGGQQLANRVQLHLALGGSFDAAAAAAVAGKGSDRT